MRIAIRIFLLLVFGAAFVAAVFYTYLGTIGPHEFTLYVPKFFKQKSSATVTICCDVGRFQLVWSRSAMHDGKDWVEYRQSAAFTGYRNIRAYSRLMEFAPRICSIGGIEVAERKLVRPVQGVGTLSTSYHSVLLPWWFVIVITGLSAGYLAITLRYALRRKLSATQCRSCGYDLRAGHGKCPECGADSHVGIGASNVTNAITAPAGQR